MISSTLLLIAVVLCLLFYVISFLSQQVRPCRTIKKHGCLPPPSIRQRDPIFGLDTLLQLVRALQENRRNKSIRQLFSTYGHTFQSTSWLSSTRIYTIEPKNLQAVFTADFSSWGVQPMRLFAFEPFVGKGIMGTDGSFWEHSRSLIKPTFTKANIADLHLAAYEVHVQHLLGLIPKNGATVDLQPLFARLALDASTEFLFGESVGSLSPRTVSKDAQSFLDAYNYGQMVVGRRLQMPKWNILTRDKRFWGSCRIAHEFVDAYIAKGVRLCNNDKQNDGVQTRAGPQPYVLAHELIKESGESPEGIRNQLLNVFLPAHEAAGVALTNIFFNLARHPEVYAKLRQAILSAEVRDGTRWTFERLKSLRYLQYVISETFRLNPAIGTNTRMALRDTVLPTGGGSPDGYGKSPVFVRKGSVITFSFYALHRRTDLFGEDANLFRPERWASLRPAHWSYVTFGGGPRVCPGQQLALTEVGYTIVKMLKAFERIENRDPVEEFVEVYKITTDSKNGTKVALIPSQEQQE